MLYPLALLWLFGGLFFLFLSAWMIKAAFRRRRMSAIERMPFPEAYRDHLRRIVQYRNLDEDEKRRIERSIMRFIHTKEFTGVRLNVSAEMKVVVAFYACLMVLKKEGYCYPGLNQILLYSRDFIVDAIEESGGIYTESSNVLQGQSGEGTVVLSWEEAEREAYQSGGYNVIIHEFAHELDFEDGAADGIPPLERSDYADWVHVMRREFAKLEKRVHGGHHLGKYGLLGEYAATNEAEFFAVTSELFFEQPQRLYDDFPELFNALARFYGCEPREWVPSSWRADAAATGENGG